MNYPFTWNFGTIAAPNFIDPSPFNNVPNPILIQKPLTIPSQNLGLEAFLHQSNLQQKFFPQVCFGKPPTVATAQNNYYLQLQGVPYNLSFDTKKFPPPHPHQMEVTQLSPIFPFRMNEEEPINQLKKSLSKMLTFFINSFGRGSLTEYRARYGSNKVLLAIFDGLHEKYRCCTKNREDMVRFILRKAISSLRDSMRAKYGLSTKAASMALCRKYFSARLQELSDKNIDLENEDQVLNFLLPYKKNSRNRTANSTFIHEIFASEEFYQDYLKFLENLDAILEADNQKRSKKLVNFLIVCAQEEDFTKIKSFKRLPWLKDWFTSVKEIGYGLLKMNKKNEDRKKAHLNLSSHSFQEKHL